MTVYEIPSLLALLFKLVLLAYAVRSPIKNGLTKLYLVLLVFMSLHNLVEFSGFVYLHNWAAGEIEKIQSFGYLYIALLIPTIAAVLHVSLRLSFDVAPSHRRHFYLLWLPVIPLEYLLLFTDKLILGFKPFQYTVLRDPGPLYFLLETFLVVYLIASLVNLIHGAISSKRAAIARARNRMWLLALAPMALLFSYLVVANHFGWTKLTSTFYAPIAMTFFLVVTTYATHQYRLFDIEFYLPWSKLRKRKTAFYQRIQNVLQEMAELPTVQQAVDTLSTVFRGPVALVQPSRRILSAASGAGQLASIPKTELKGIDHIVVAYEIAESHPALFESMQRHGIGAIVPFHPRHREASGWLLLGRNFSEEVYTPKDFRLVEQLFARLADLFLERLLEQRSQLADADSKIETLKSELDDLRERFEAAQARIAELSLLQPADSAAAMSQQLIAKSVAPTYIGRNKPLFAALRESFESARQVASPTSAVLWRGPLPELLACSLDQPSKAETKQLLKLLRAETSGAVRAAVLTGAEAHTFLATHRQQLGEVLIEYLPEPSPSLLTRRLAALDVLRGALHFHADPDHPLIGRTTTFRSLMERASRLAGLRDALVIAANDVAEALSLARYLHERGTAHGALRVEHPSAASTPAEVDAWIDASAHGSLALVNADVLSDAAWPRLISRAQQSDVRLLCLCAGDEPAARVLRSLAPAAGISLRVPSLSERSEDLPLLVHYFTLQYNLRNLESIPRYLTQADLSAAPIAQANSLDLLRAAVMDALTQAVVQAESSPNGASVVEHLEHESSAIKTLDEWMAEYEARIIEETLKRCNGNKSQAARLLGIRPNTLHYKIERYQNKASGGADGDGEQSFA